MDLGLNYCQGGQDGQGGQGGQRGQDKLKQHVVHVYAALHNVRGVPKRHLTACITRVENEGDLGALDLGALDLGALVAGCDATEYTFSDPAMTAAQLGKFVARAWHLGPLEVVHMLLLKRHGKKLVCLHPDCSVLSLVPLDPYGKDFNPDGEDGFASGEGTQEEEEEVEEEEEE